MENDVLVGRVRVVVMAVPVGSTNMKFDIASPEMSVNTQFRIESVGTRIVVRNAGGDNLDNLAEESPLNRNVQPVEPDIRDERFVHSGCKGSENFWCSEEKSRKNAILWKRTKANRRES